MTETRSDLVVFGVFSEVNENSELRNMVTMLFSMAIATVLVVLFEVGSVLKVILEKGGETVCRL
jgi:hypothetical protein